ncbi:hypothetical protein T484DRAFT_1751518 [Baffinella frigidus]|nr:hypothetical protein T484DRAFT_1751518 [Cryptophyta sp. CCMP2293]
MTLDVHHPALEAPHKTADDTPRPCASESPSIRSSDVGSVLSSRWGRLSSVTSTSSSASLPNAYAMVATSFAESKSRAVRDWNEGRCKRAYKSKSLVNTAIVSSFFREELVRLMASPRTRPRDA